MGNVLLCILFAALALLYGTSAVIEKDKGPKIASILGAILWIALFIANIM